MGSTDAPNVCILDGVAHRPPLYLLIEGQGDDAHAARMASAAADAYQRTRGSLTGALLAVVRAVELAQRSAKPSALPQYGISALVISGAEAILAQVEPAACWHLQDGDLHRLPAQSAWFDPGMDAAALRHLGGGLGQDEPELTRIALQPGDRFLLGTSSISRDVGEFLIAEALAQNNPAAALHELVPDLTFSALSVQPPVPPRPKPAPAKRAEPRKVGRVSPIPITEPYPSVLAAAKELPALRSPGQQPPLRREAHPAESLRQARPRRRRAWSLPSIGIRPYFEVIIIAVLFILKFFWAILSGFFSLLSRALPDRETPPFLRAPQARRPVMESNPLENRVLFTLAIAIPVLVLIGVAALRNQSAAAQTVHVADVMNRAEAAYQSAVSMQNADARKAALNQASQLIDEVITANPRDQVAKDLQGKIVNELDKLNNVTKFFFYPVLFSFDEKDSRPTTVIGRGNEIYVLDAGLNRLYKFVLNDNKEALAASARSATPVPTPSPVILSQGEQRGSVVVGRLADIFWGSAGAGRSGTGVLTLTASKQLMEYLPSKGVNALSLAAANGWKEATLGESYKGNLYVLDANANRILKFAPSGEDYRSTPTDYVAPGQKVDFAGAVDMAIDEFVWVLLADGTVMKFDKGNLLPFDKKGLEQPLRKPVAMSLPPPPPSGTPSVWVGDAGNRRIVQFTKGGDFVKQLKPDDPNVMNDLRGLAVDEVGKRFYFVNANRLYMGILQN